ncbi:tyrosine-type recombinase/integrase [Fischerella sp. PCC 9605]|uniref:tyrosine-type recombinase/integrase n=1 Tax=Fischerella sp. PCC 9605 TaxID=1173024 RepID=UPI00047DE05E|nr:site-specific integrase [Fischerella sp. PCC 9605]
MEYQIKLNHKNEQQDCYKVIWTQERFQEIETSLTGYWSKDIWEGVENPFKNKDRTSLILNFSNHLYIIKTELKFVIYTKMSTHEWSWTTVHVNNVLKDVIDFLGDSRLIVEDKSIIEMSIDYLVSKLTDHFQEQKKLYSTTSRTCNKYGEPQFYKSKDQRVYMLTHIYKFLQDFYDIRDEYDKDAWNINKLSPKHNGRERNLDFSELKGSWLFKPVRAYIKYQLAIHKGVTVYNKLRCLRIFGIFLIKRYPKTTPENLDRELIVDYINYVKHFLNSSYIHQHHCLSYLKEFLELCQRQQWVNLPRQQLIYFDDFPKSKRKINPNYIPDEVVREIYQHIDKLSYPMYGRMFLLQMQIGCRVIDLRHLEYNCLTQVKEGQYILKYWNFKQSKQHTIPANSDVVNLIRTQQKQVSAELGEDYPYLFPSRRVKTNNQVKPVSTKAYSEAIKRLIWKNNIRDNNGKRWVFTSHQCRHTVATTLINDGVPQHIVQKFLGHESPTMTNAYAHIFDDTLRKEIEKYHESRVINFQGETVELEESILSSNEDLEWFKRNVQARALEHGYCARPKVLGDCDIPGFDGCYNCPHWRTNKNFLAVLKDTLERTNNVLEKAQNCGWQLQIHKNTPIKENLEKVIKTLEVDND